MKDTSAPTQNNLPIAGIQDNVVIMNDGGIRVVLKIDPINFELKSEDEQNSTIYGYQGFLNSLSFPIQIIIRSKRLDLQSYLGRMEKYKKNITNDLLKIQIEDYVGFVNNLISVANIMSKQFYVVIDYSPISTKNLTTTITKILHQQVTEPLIDEEQFERYKAEIFNRANIVGGGLSRLGLRVHALNTQQLIELFYSIYNPDSAEDEKLTDVSNIISESISSSVNVPEPTEQSPATPESTILNNSVENSDFIVPAPDVPEPTTKEKSAPESFSNIADSTLDEPPIEGTPSEKPTNNNPQ